MFLISSQSRGCLLRRRIVSPSVASSHVLSTHPPLSPSPSRDSPFFGPHPDSIPTLSSPSFPLPSSSLSPRSSPSLSPSIPPLSISDPLFLGRLSLDPDFPPLTSGEEILSRLEDLVGDRKNLDRPLLASDEVLRHFNRVFNEVVEWNDVGRFSPTTRGVVDVAVDDNEDDAERERDVYVGGPAALCAASLQAKHGMGSDVLYLHDDRRALSNWKGSASYFHIRDAVPVYYWPDNNGAYAIFATLSHALQRRASPKSYARRIDEEPNWNKLRIDWRSVGDDLLRNCRLFAENQIRAMRDVGLRYGNPLTAPESTAAFLSTHHASLTPEILEALDAPKPLLMKSSQEARTLHLLFDEGKVTDSVFDHLRRVCGEVVANRSLKAKEIAARGFDGEFVKRAIEFPNDGYFPPYIGQVMEGMVTAAGGRVRSGLRLKTILVKPDGDGDTRVSRIICEDTTSSEESLIKVKSLYLSLGPTVTVINAPTNSDFPRSNLLRHFIHAAGVSMIILVRVDWKRLSTETELRRFRDHIDGHNKQIVRLGEKTVESEGRTWQYFALQVTSGGHFPSTSAHPEVALNMFRAFSVPTLRLEDSGVEFDIVSVRSCARAVSAQNIFRLSTPANNLAILYAIGGIGMTTMAPNALLMHAVLGLRRRISSEGAAAAQFGAALRSSDFGGDIPNWRRPNPFRRNYSQLVDDADDPRVLAKRLGFAGGELKRLKIFYV